jgi:hypothetical protein
MTRSQITARSGSANPQDHAWRLAFGQHQSRLPGAYGGKRPTQRVRPRSNPHFWAVTSDDRQAIEVALFERLKLNKWTVTCTPFTGFSHISRGPTEK